MKIINYSLLLLFIVASNQVLAETKGKRYGASVSYFSYDSYAPEGQAGSADSLRYSVVHTRPIDLNSARWRWWFSGSYMTQNISAQPRGVYQELDNFEFRVVPQYAIPVGDWVTPFVGTGISLGYSRYTQRWNVDDDGYKYGERLPNEGRFDAALVFNAGIVFKLGSNPNAHLQLIPHVSYLASYESALPGLEMGLTLLF